MKCFGLKFLCVALVAAGAGLGGCAAKRYTPEQLTALENKSEAALTRLSEREPEFEGVKSASIAHAIFPTIGQGGWGLGFGLGEGLLYENGKVTGTARYSEVSYGFQLGGLAGSRVLFFMTPEALEDFKDGGEFRGGLETNAVAGTRGVSGAGEWANGTETFRTPKSGLMVHAAIKGGTYKFRAIEDAMKAEDEDDDHDEWDDDESEDDYDESEDGDEE